MSDTLIVNARLINEGREFDADLRISRGRIAAIGTGLAARDGEAVVDANGRRLLPGMIDDQVHFREPGMEYKADMATESTAAAAGGVTSFMDMPNTSPPTLSAEALELARTHGTRLHVLHISTADELALFTPGPLIDANGVRKRITAETCIHFLRFDRDDYARLGHLIKCNPAIKDASDREALINALASDVIDVLATDHAPHTWEEKHNPYVRAPSGLPLVQYALVAALELVREGRLTNAQVVQKLAHAPAQLFDVAERGFLREGYFADLALVDDTPFTVRREDVLSKCAWSPFEGTTFHSRIASTWVNGQLAWDGAKLVGEPVGSRLAFAR
jgi:dihydroorotase-like cyclic amidohydrolase